MAESSSSAGRGGPGLAILLTVLFVGLKLGEVGVVADWSWWWVVSPLWISFLLFLLIMAGIVIVALVAAARSDRRTYTVRRRRG